ncbi:M10 family metallopeptidase C-terminal domain-containing protein [Paracoccus simplex]|uniref:M10 family metallopeptidase C-terminal domain-containing protein n=1 Tax=Paracoccus simplex TaxID=2086346 RepID=A0ABV7S0N0_9RHOB
MRYRHVATYTGADAPFVTNITDLQTHAGPDGHALYSLTHVGGGMVAWHVVSADQPIEVMTTRAYPAGIGHAGPPSASIVTLGGNPVLIGTGLRAGPDPGIRLDSQGGFQDGAGPGALPADLIGLQQLQTPLGDFLCSARNGQTAIDIWRIGADGGLGHVTRAALPAGSGIQGTEIDALHVTTLADRSFIIAASGLGNYVSVQIVMADGTLGPVQMLWSYRGLGMDQPSHLDTVTVAGVTYLVVAGAQSSSLTTMRLTYGGELLPADHVVDERSTRFAGATALETVTMDGRAFVFVGGGDDGISVFTVLPDGKLLHLTTLVDTDDQTLADVSALSAAVIDGRIALFVSSRTESGITQFVLEPGSIGKTGVVGAGRQTGTGGSDLMQASAGTTVLDGGAGDDILIAGAEPLRMTGGAGADVFVVKEVGGKITITDFEPGVDRLDLSFLGMIRSTDQLVFRPQAFGIKIFYGNSVIWVTTPDNSMLQAGAFDNSLFPIAHYEAPDMRTTVSGTLRNDTLSAGRNGSNVFGYAGNDLLLGGAGNDDLSGALGNDTLRGGDGNDRLFGGDGNDRLFGSTGNDRLWAGSGDDALAGGAGNDTLRGETGHDLLYGEGGDDAMFDLLGNNTLWGGDGNDLMQTGTGNDRLYGGPGSDTLIAGAGLDYLFGGLGNDSMAGGAGIDTLLGGEGNDWIDGGAGNDSLDGGNGNDTLYGGDGHDLILGGGGHDRITDMLGNGVLWGGDGNDLMQSGAGNDRLHGGPGNDTLIAGAGFDYLLGGLGNDSLNGGGGFDTLIGAEGDDRMDGGDGIDNLDGGTGNDTLAGGDGHDVLNGAEGNDALHGGTGHDTLYGMAGADLMNGNQDHDLMFGGADNDTMLGGFGNDVMQGESGDDSLDGGPENDTLSGGAGNDVILGGGGHDVIDGGSGNDLLYGGSGHDLILGGEGDDLIHAETGNNTVQGGAGSDAILGDAGADWLQGDDGRDTIQGLAGGDTLLGGADDDLLDGGDGDDLLDGGQGNDNLIGGLGGDRLAGAAGDDTVTGGLGNDLLEGGEGADRLEGGRGFDTLTGGAGADVFVFADAGDLDGCSDAITDFRAGEDRIDLSGLGLVFIGGTAFSANGSGQVRLDWTQPDAHRLLVDRDGDGRTDLTIDLGALATLNASDLLL